MITIVAAITTPMIPWKAMLYCFSIRVLTALASKITVSSAPIPAGIKTPKSNLPIPVTSGVYNPSGINSVEKLNPGAITLSAMQNPQNRYQTKFGSILA